MCVLGKLRLFVKKIGKTPNAVATELGKSSGSVTSWKNGTIPYEKTLQQIADYFGITKEELIGEFIPSKQKAPPVNGDAELTEYLEELRTRPEMRMLFHTFAGATKEQVEAIVKAWETMQGK